MGVKDLFGKLCGLLGLDRTEPSGGSKGLILIADDDASLRNVISRSLMAAGYEILQAEDGARTIEVCREHRPDMVLLDIYMPNKNGLKVLEELAPEMPGTGFLIMTGNEDEETARACLKMGAFDYIPKPVDLVILLDVIKHHRLKQAS